MSIYARYNFGTRSLMIDVIIVTAWKVTLFAFIVLVSKQATVCGVGKILHYNKWRHYVTFQDCKYLNLTVVYQMQYHQRSCFYFCLICIFCFAYRIYREESFDNSAEL